MAYVNLIATEIVFNIWASGSHVGLLMAFSEHRRWIISVFDRRSIMNRLYITSRWDTFVLFHLYGNKGVSLPLWPIRPRLFHTFSSCAEPLGDGHQGMGARFGSQGSIALNWHSRYSGTRYSGTWLYIYMCVSSACAIQWLTLEAQRLYECIIDGKYLIIFLCVKFQLVM